MTTPEMPAKAALGVFVAMICVVNRCLAVLYGAAGRLALGLVRALRWLQALQGLNVLISLQLDEAVEDVMASINVTAAKMTDCVRMHNVFTSRCHNRGDSLAVMRHSAGGKPLDCACPKLPDPPGWLSRDIFDMDDMRMPPMRGLPECMRLMSMP